MDQEEVGERLVRLETQILRIVSDAESEKDTRRRTNTEFEKRFSKIEQTIWKSSGAVALLLVLINLYLAYK